VRTELDAAGDPEHTVAPPPVRQRAEGDGEEQRAQALEALQPSDHAVVAVLLWCIGLVLVEGSPQFSTVMLTMDFWTRMEVGHLVAMQRWIRTVIETKLENAASSHTPVASA